MNGNEDIRKIHTELRDLIKQLNLGTINKVIFLEGINKVEEDLLKYLSE